MSPRPGDEWMIFRAKRKDPVADIIARLEGKVEPSKVQERQLPFGSRKPIPTERKKRARSYSNKKNRPACANCSTKHWIRVDDHALYRDPFLECGNCKATFHMDLTPLDINYAYRDGIQMPEEVRHKYSFRRTLRS